jgi:predicted cupin superfamily sugar epimerase
VGTPRGERSALTVIDYLLPAGAFSARHRVHADEVWQHAGGDPG